jgi:hypothetical protein
MSLDQRRRELAYRVRYLLNAYPAVYMPIARARHGARPDYLVRRDTELVIEGAARSGNTFAVLAFASAQERPVRTAHHTHAPAQVLTAARWGIPMLVLVRPPLDSALAHMALRGVPADAALAAWIRFHRSILPVRDDFVVASFAEVTGDFGAAVARVNDRFGTSFGVFEHTPENQAAVFAAIERRNRELRAGRKGAERDLILARPTPERSALKDRLREQLDAPGLEGRRAEAAALYRRLVGKPAPVR